MSETDALIMVNKWDEHNHKASKMINMIEIGDTNA